MCVGMHVWVCCGSVGVCAGACMCVAKMQPSAGNAGKPPEDTGCSCPGEGALPCWDQRDSRPWRRWQSRRRNQEGPGGLQALPKWVSFRGIGRCVEHRHFHPLTGAFLRSEKRPHLQFSSMAIAGRRGAAGTGFKTRSPEAALAGELGAAWCRVSPRPGELAIPMENPGCWGPGLWLHFRQTRSLALEAEGHSRGNLDGCVEGPLSWASRVAERGGKLGGHPRLLSSHPPHTYTQRRGAAGTPASPPLGCSHCDSNKQKTDLG